MKLTDKQRQDAIVAAKKGARAAWTKSNSKSGLKWWQKLLWVALAAGAAAVSCLLSGCGQMRAWDELTPPQQQTLRAADHTYHQWSGQRTIAKGEK